MDAFCKIRTLDSWFAQNYRLYLNDEEVKEVSLPHGIDYIYEVFSCCMSLEKLIIPESSIYVSGGAFFLCKNLKDVVNHSGYPQAIYRYGEEIINATRPLSRAGTDTSDEVTPFGQVDKNECTLYVPSGSASRYSTADEWKTFQHIVEVLFGDANGDGNVNMEDVYVVKDYIITGKTEGFYFNNADANGDNKVNAADIVMILNIIKNK